MEPNRYSLRMQSFCQKAGTIPNLVLAVVLIAAQSVVSTHAFEHEAGNTQNPVCTTCVAASQLGATAVDTGSIFVAKDSTHIDTEASVSRFDSLHPPTARQRGPPAPL